MSTSSGLTGESSPGRAMIAGLVVAAFGAAGVVIVALEDPRRALLGWLAAYAFGLGTALGALVLAMVFHVTDARWPLVLRPYVMAVAGVTPLFALLFLPIALGLRAAYPWAHPAAAEQASESASAAAAHAHQLLWQAPSFFLVRAGVYLGAWMILAISLGRADARHDREPTPANARRQHRISAAGIPALALTMTFASFDWFMAAEPGWVSDMYGLYFFAGGLASAVSMVAIVAWLATRHAPASRAPGPDHFGAVGRLMLMATVLWAYIAFFQLLLVWIANLPREVGFYVSRSQSGYQIIDAFLIFGHFVGPFLVLLSRPLKQRPAALAVVAAWIVLMDAVDVAWLVLPAAGGGLRILDAAPFLVIGGLAVAYGAHRFQKPGVATLPPAGDPLLEESLRYRSP